MGGSFWSKCLVGLDLGESGKGENWSSTMGVPDVWREEAWTMPGIDFGSVMGSGGGSGVVWMDLASLRLWAMRQESLQYLRGFVEESEHSVPQFRQFMFGIYRRNRTSVKWVCSESFTYNWSGASRRKGRPGDRSCKPHCTSGILTGLG
jgi:hypothetical protein